MSVTATEMTFTQGTSDKFYRVLRVGAAVTCQYGRTGTYGIFTARKDYGSVEEATKAADKAIAGKMAEGYEVVRCGELALADSATESALDAAVNLIRVRGAEKPAAHCTIDQLGAATDRSV